MFLNLARLLRASTRFMRVSVERAYTRRFNKNIHETNVRIICILNTTLNKRASYNPTLIALALRIVSVRQIHFTLLLPLLFQSTASLNIPQPTESLIRLHHFAKQNHFLQFDRYDNHRLLLKYRVLLRKSNALAYLLKMTQPNPPHPVPPTQSCAHEWDLKDDHPLSNDARNHHHLPQQLSDHPTLLLLL